MIVVPDRLVPIAVDTSARFPSSSLDSWNLSYKTEADNAISCILAFPASSGVNKLTPDKPSLNIPTASAICGAYRLDSFSLSAIFPIAIAPRCASSRVTDIAFCIDVMCLSHLKMRNNITPTIAAINANIGPSDATMLNNPPSGKLPINDIYLD